MRKLFQKLGLINNQAQSSTSVDVELDVSVGNSNTQNGQPSSSDLFNNSEKKVFDELDEEFVYNFIRDGGKFMFCLSKRSLYQSINYVVNQNGWNNVYVSESNIQSLLKDNKTLKIDGKHNTSDVFISSCDNLVSYNGRIMVSSNQCKGLNFSELPDNHIIIANHSQIVKNLGDGLRRINSKYFKNLPSKITTIKNIKSTKNNDTAKNIYVFLLEDY